MHTTVHNTLGNTGLEYFIDYSNITIQNLYCAVTFYQVPLKESYGQNAFDNTS